MKKLISGISKCLSLLLIVSLLITPIPAKAAIDTSPLRMDPVYTYSQSITSDVVIDNHYTPVAWKECARGRGWTITLSYTEYNMWKIEGFISGTYDSKTIGVVNAKLGITIGKSSVFKSALGLAAPKDGKYYIGLYRPYYRRHKLTVTEYVHGPGVNIVNRTFVTYVDEFVSFETDYKLG